MIVIPESKTADSRTAKGPVTKAQLTSSSKQHQEDVKEGLAFFADLLHKAALAHDKTKISCINTFYEDFIRSQADKEFEFKRALWFQLHVAEERHHLKDRCPDDVNLIDVLEHISDIVMAGMGRKGEVTPDTLPAGLLEKAYANTIKLLTENVEVH